MARHGFIHSKEDIKFMVLFALDKVPFPIDFNTILDLITWCDDGFGYFEFNEAFYEMIPTGHIKEQTIDGTTVYAITEKGCTAIQELEKHLPYPVREAAQRSAIRVVRQIRRDAAIHTAVRELTPQDLVVRLEMDDVFAIEINVVNRVQAAMLERNFRDNAEAIYKTLLPALLTDYNDNDFNTEGKAKKPQ